LPASSGPTPRSLLGLPYLGFAGPARRAPRSRLWELGGVGSGPWSLAAGMSKGCVWGPAGPDTKVVHSCVLVFAPQSKVAPQETPPPGNPRFRRASVSDWRRQLFPELEGHEGNSYLSCSFKSYQRPPGLLHTRACSACHALPLGSPATVFLNIAPQVAAAQIEIQDKR
jgi:hypothetical protein